MNGIAAAYLSSYFTRVADVPSQQRLRSTSTNQFALYRRSTSPVSTVGKRAFPVSGANFCRTVFHYTWHLHRRSRYSESVL